MKYVLFAAIACLSMSSAMAAVTPTPDSPPNDGTHNDHKDSRVRFECQFLGPAWKGSACEANGTVCVRRHHDGQMQIVDDNECRDEELSTTGNDDHRRDNEGHLTAFCTDGFRVDARAFASREEDRFDIRNLRILTRPRFDGPWDVRAGILINQFEDFDRDGDHDRDRRDYRAQFIRGFDGVPPDPMWGYCRLHSDRDDAELANQ